MKTSRSARFCHIEGGGWTIPNPRVYRCRVYLIPVWGGGYSVRVADLPGCASHGDTMAQALDRVKEALQGCLTEYRKAGEIPWQETPEPDEPFWNATVYVEVPDGS